MTGISRSRLAALAVCALTPLALPAQVYRFRNFGTEDGLRNLAILSLAQDRQGYLWAGSLNGLYRYDGDRFERFGLEDGLPSIQISALAETRDGRMWAATLDGVAFWSGKHFVPVKTGAGLRLRSASALAADPRNPILWAASDRGLVKIDLSGGSTASPKASFATFASGAVISMVGFASDGALWYGAGGLLHRAIGGGIVNYGKESGVPDDNWEAIASDASGVLWARSSSRLIYLSPGQTRFARVDVPPAEFGALALDRNGRVVVPTTLGLALRTGDSWSFLRSENGLPMDSVSTFIVDREGSPWIGMNGGGVARWLGAGSWEGWTAPRWLANDAIWSIAEDSAGRIWTGSNAGITQIPLAGSQAAFPPNVRFDVGDVVRALASGSGERLWAGTGHKGLFRCETTRGVCASIGKEAGLPALEIVNLIVDRAHVLWAATDKGVFFADADSPRPQFRALSIPGSEPGEGAGKAEVGPQGELIVGTRRGLWIYSRQSWRRIGRTDGLLDDEISQVAVDKRGAIYVSYNKLAGLSRIVLDGDRTLQLTHFSNGSPLQSTFLYTLEADAKGRLWAGTDSGIDVLEKGNWRHYGPDEGLIWPDLNTNAFLADTRGGVWFGTSRGLAHLQPDLNLASPAPPDPLITRITIDDKHRDSLGTIWAPYRNRDIWMRFSSLSFLNEKNIRFEYRLKGLEDQWREIEGRDLHLLNLPPGNYSFELRARTAADVRSSRPARVSIEVETPWWKTWLFYGFCALALATVSNGAWLWRHRKLRLRREELEQMVKERTNALVAERTSLLQAREALREQALRDPLTNLWNRRAIFSILEKLLREARQQSRQIAVIMADLDNFKGVNDRYGHLTGDDVLAEAAARFAQALGGVGCLGRYGGEELIVALPEADLDRALNVAEKLRDRMESYPFESRGALIPLTCSFGVAISTDEDTGLEAVIARADHALYQAKRSGRNRVGCAAGSMEQEVLA